jgi:hypothetical protein
MIAADLVMNMVLALMVIFKIITIRNALVGFSNSGLMTVVGALTLSAAVFPELDLKHLPC